MHAHMPKATPVMTVVHGGETYQVSVEPGPEGQAEFMRQIRSIFGLAPEDSVQLTFGCKVPGSSEWPAGSGKQGGGTRHALAIVLL